ncbi:MAG TPA: hypothetical protein VFN33_03515 [Gaiellaceae bacterium]|nr:hypothetical protein [Gaiellaceae bacterium]
MAVAAPPEREQPSAHDANPAPVDEAREDAIANLKRKRKFAQDTVAYVTVNGLLWLIWLIADRSTARPTAVFRGPPGSLWPGGSFSPWTAGAPTADGRRT